MDRDRIEEKTEYRQSQTTVRPSVRKRCSPYDWLPLSVGGGIYRSSDGRERMRQGPPTKISSPIAIVGTSSSLAQNLRVTDRVPASLLCHRPHVDDEAACALLPTISISGQSKQVGIYTHMQSFRHNSIIIHINRA